MDKDLQQQIKKLERLCRQTNKAVDDLAKRVEGLADTMVSPQAIERRKLRALWVKEGRCANCGQPRGKRYRYRCEPCQAREKRVGPEAPRGRKRTMKFQGDPLTFVR